MRHIKTFILHIYTDLELREKTCGNLQALPGRKTHSFKDDTELLQLLQSLSKEETKDLPMNDSNLSTSQQSIK